MFNFHFLKTTENVVIVQQYVKQLLLMNRHVISMICDSTVSLSFNDFDALSVCPFINCNDFFFRHLNACCFLRVFSTSYQSLLLFAILISLCKVH